MSPRIDRRMLHSAIGLAVSVEEGAMLATNDASALYASARCAGRARQIWAKLRGHSQRLLDLNTVAASGSVGDRHAAGVQAVAIRQIRGSEGRCDDFDVG